VNSFLTKVNARNHRNKVSKLIKQLKLNPSSTNPALSTAIEPSLLLPVDSSSILDSVDSVMEEETRVEEESTGSINDGAKSIDDEDLEEESTGSINDGAESIDNEDLDANGIIEEVVAVDMDDEDFEDDVDEGDNIIEADGSLTVYRAGFIETLVSNQSLSNVIGNNITIADLRGMYAGNKIRPLVLKVYWRLLDDKQKKQQSVHIERSRLMFYGGDFSTAVSEYFGFEPMENFFFGIQCTYAYYLYRVSSFQKIPVYHRLISISCRKNICSFN